MIDEICADADERMGKSLDALQAVLAKIRTGRANPGLVESIPVPYYGSDTPLKQIASITVEDARTLVISPWEKEPRRRHRKSVAKSDLGITPASAGDVVRVPLPPLTEQNRKDLAKQARAEGENARGAIRNIRRDAISDIRELVKEKEVAEDDAHRGEERMQKLTDSHVAEVEKIVAAKESELMEI